MPKLSGKGVYLLGAQVRAARGLLGLSAETLAEETKLSLRTVQRAERNDGVVEITAANAERVVSVLEAKGIRFIDDEDELGVTLAKRRPGRSRRLRPAG